MKKIFFALGLLALAVSGFIMFKILNFNDDEISETSSKKVGNETETQSENTSPQA